MIDYFIHFINKLLHLLRSYRLPSINHRSDRTDKLTDFFRTHAGLLSNPIERAFIIRHVFHIHLDFSSQLFGKVNIQFQRMQRKVFMLHGFQRNS